MIKSTLNNILIVRTDRIGDVILTTPAIRAIKEAYPKTKITLLVSPLTQDLISKNPFVDEILLDDRKNINKGILGFVKLISSIRRRKFDLAIVYHTKKRTNLACFLAGIEYRIGYKNNKFGFLLNHPVSDKRHLGEKHETEYCLELLSHLGIKSNNLSLDISVNNDNEKWAEEFIEKNIAKDKKIIAIHAGASGPEKCWPSENFVELINEIGKRFQGVFILIGASHIKEISNKIKEKASAEIIDMAGKTTISQLVSLLKRCDLLISNDSGPVHMASALNTPVISIFTRNSPGINPERWKPLGENSIFIGPPASKEDVLKKVVETLEKTNDRR